MFISLSDISVCLPFRVSQISTTIFKMKRYKIKIYFWATLPDWYCQCWMSSSCWCCAYSAQSVWIWTVTQFLLFWLNTPNTLDLRTMNMRIVTISFNMRVFRSVFCGPCRNCSSFYTVSLSKYLSFTNAEKRLKDWQSHNKFNQSYIFKPFSFVRLTYSQCKPVWAWRWQAGL